MVLRYNVWNDNVKVAFAPAWVGRPEPSHSADPPDGPAKNSGRRTGGDRHCAGLNDAGLKQANPVGQAALHKAVVLHGPKINLVK